MNPIHSVDAPFRRVSGEIQGQTPSHNGEMQGEGRPHVYGQSGFDRNYFFRMLKPVGGMVMIDSLREIHIKICSARIVMYSQRHVC